MIRRGLVGAVAVVAVGACSRRAPPVGEDAAAPVVASASASASPSAPRPTVALGRVGDGRAGGTIVLARWSGRTVAIVADEDERAIRVVDIDSGKELSSTKPGSAPAQLLVAADGRLLVALRDESVLASFHATEDLAAPLVAAARVVTATEPVGLAATPDDASVLVVSGWGHTLEAFRATSLERTLSVDVPREPRAVTTSSDGATAFVAHAVATQVTAVDLRADAPKPTGIDLTLGPWMGGDDSSGPDFPSRVARGAFAIVRLDGKRERLFVPHVLVDPGNSLAVTSGYGGPTSTATMPGGGVPFEAFTPDGPLGPRHPALPAATVVPTAGTHVFEVDVLDPKKRVLATPGRMPMVVEDTTRGGKGACLLPRAAAIDAAHAELLVACLGVDEVRAFDATRDDPTGRKPRRRWSVPAGASGIVVDPERERALVWSAFDGVVSVLSLARPARGDDGATPEPARIPLARTKPLPEAVALGRKLFFTAGDPRIARDGRACASCHIDGREDGLTWSSPQGPRQTMMLAGRADHLPPFGWLGEHPTLQAHVLQTLRNLAGTGLEPPELDALAAWLTAMKGPPSTTHRQTEAEMHGRDLFQSAVADCSSCHVATGGFTDHMTHEVGSATGVDKVAAFVTPSLRYLGGTAPYFHDGRYATLAALLGDHKTKMGDTRPLSADDRAALEAYLATL
jgi:mono/diheme cytochrome c family protein